MVKTTLRSPILMFLSTKKKPVKKYVIRKTVNLGYSSNAFSAAMRKLYKADKIKYVKLKGIVLKR